MTTKKNSSQKWLWAGAALLIIALAVAGFVLPVKEWAESFKSWIEGFGAWGPVIFALVYIAATVLLIPAGPLTLAAGLAFGAWAFPLVVGAATIGAALAFLVARYLAHKKVHKLIASKPKWKAVSTAVSEGGWKIVGLLRLSPAVPFSLQNYAMGVFDIGFWPYVLATFFGIMPGTLLYVYLGALGQQAGKGVSAAQWTFYGVGLVATVLTAVLITRKASAELHKSGVGRKPAAPGKNTRKK